MPTFNSLCRVRLPLSSALLCGSLLASVAVAAAPVDDKRIKAAGNDNADWLTHGRTYDEQRFSPLAQIDQSNVKELKLAWYFDLDTKRGQEATPLVVDGTMYVTSAWSKVLRSTRAPARKSGASTRRSRATRQSMPAATSSIAASPPGGAVFSSARSTGG